MKFRNGFISNSSSTAFIIPKKYLSKEDLEIYHDYMHDNYDCDDELNEGEAYIHGNVSMHNKELNRLFKKFKGKEGVEYEI